MPLKLPAPRVGQFVDRVDLDRPLPMANDTTPAALYAQGCIDFAPDALRLNAALS